MQRNGPCLWINTRIGSKNIGMPGKAGFCQRRMPECQGGVTYFGVVSSTCAMSSMQKLVAVMYTDIVGYTAITDADEGRALQLHDRHKKLVREGLEKYNGVLQELIGDGSLSYFSSASDCLQCAMGLQAQFREDPQVPVRIGIHIGEVRGDLGLVFGNPLNVASRIESMSEAGAVLISRNVIDSLSTKSDFLFVSLGMFSFKNVDKPIEIYALANPGLKVPDREMVSGKFKILERKDIIVFDEWDDRELASRFETASVICQQAVCSYGFINYNYSKLRAFINRGGQFECIMIHPESKALMVSPERQAGAASEISYVQGQLQLAYQKLKPLAKGVRFLLTHHLPDPIMTFVDPESEDGVLFITLTGFQMDLHARPSFVLRKSTHRRWFDFYYEGYVKMRGSDATAAVDFGRSWEEVVKD